MYNLEAKTYSLESKHIFAMYVIGIISALQVAAWVLGKNGGIFAFTSLVIGGIVGSILGIALKKK